MQILINLITNAKQAMKDVARKELIVKTEAQDGIARIVVCDNGYGIAPENMTRIFSHGFTTKPDGHGFGLHAGSLAAKEMGGTLQAQSDGPGQGATFTLELPLKRVPANA